MLHFQLENNVQLRETYRIHYNRILLSLHIRSHLKL